MALSALLLVLGTARLVRFVVTDKIPGELWILRPLENLRNRSLEKHLREDAAAGLSSMRANKRWDEREDRWNTYLDGLTCPFCVGQWICFFTTASLCGAWFAGGTLLLVWQWVMGAFALNYVTGHINRIMD